MFVSTPLQFYEELFVAVGDGAVMAVEDFSCIPGGPVAGIAEVKGGKGCLERPAQGGWHDIIIRYAERPGPSLIL